MNSDVLSADIGRLVLRVSVAGLMLFHGVAKIMHPSSLEFISGMLASNSLPSFLAYGVYIGEVVAPLMVLIGYLTRVGALLMVVNMLIAILLAHTGDLFSLTEHGGYALELQMLYLMGSAAIMFFGSGKYAVRPD